MRSCRSRVRLIASMASIAVPLSLVAAFSDTCACLGSDGKDLVQEYERGLDVLKIYFGTFQVRGVLTRVMEVKDGSGAAKLIETRTEFGAEVCNGNVKITKIPETKQQASEQPGQGKAPSYTEATYVQGPDQPFIARRSSKGGKFALQARGNGPEGAPAARLFETEINSYFRAPISIDGRYIPDIIASSDFKFTKASEIQRDGHKMIKLDFQYKPAQTPERGIYGWFVADPVLRMAIIEFDSRYFVIRHGTTTFYHGSIKYAPSTADGYPVPERIEYIYNNKYERNRDVNEKRTFVVTEFSRRAIPASEFTMASFGLSDANVIPVQHSSRVPFWLLGVGLIALVISILLARRGWAQRVKKMS